MPIPLFSYFYLIIPKETIQHKLNLTIEDYIARLGFDQPEKYVFQDDFLIAIKAPDPDNLLSDALIGGLNFDVENKCSNDFVIASIHHPEVFYWKVDWILEDRQVVVFADQYASVKERLAEVNNLPYRKFIEFWQQGGF